MFAHTYGAERLKPRRPRQPGPDLPERPETRPQRRLTPSRRSLYLHYGASKQEYRDRRPNGTGDRAASGNQAASAARAGAAPRACCAGLEEFLSPKLFKALSDPRRLSLLVRLSEEGRPCTVGQIAEGSGIDLSVVSRHLAVLREAGVISCEKQGKEVWCRVQTGATAQILRDLADALEACCPTCPPDERTTP